MNKREFLKQQYPKSKGWHGRVDHMSEQQVDAIYIRLKGKMK